jgi:hypothetical protein
MTRHDLRRREGAADPRTDTQYKCFSCNGIIPGLADQDLAIGLNMKVGLVSDECALICNECTAKLIEAQTPQGSSARR